MNEITMTSNNNGSQDLGEDNSSLSQDPPQAITITIMEPSSAYGETLDTQSISATNLNHNLSSIVSSGSNAGTVFVVPRIGTTGEIASSTVNSKKEHVLQTSISKTQLEEELPVISNISNPEEVVNEGQDVTKGQVGDGEEGDIVAASDPHCLICNKELPQNTEHDTMQVAIFQVQTTATQRKMSVLLGVLIGQKITSRKSHSDLVCSRCYNLLDKVDSLEVELQDTKDDIINKYQTTLAIYGGRPRRRKPVTSKKTDFVFPKLEPDELEKEVSLELDSNFEPRAEDLLEEAADQQEDLIASGALDDEWEPEFKRPRFKRENVDADPGVAPKRRRGRPKKDAAKAKVLKKGTEITALTTSSALSTIGRILPSRRIVTVPDTFRKCPHCPIIFLNKVHLGKHLEKQHTQHHQQRQCQNCKLSFYTYEYNKICDECLTEIRKNIIESSKNNDDCLTALRKNITETSKNYETSSSISQLFCRDCNLKYPTKMILDLHCLSTGHNMDCGDKNFNIKQKELIGPENSSKLSSKSIQVENEIKDEFVMKDENHFLHKVNEDKTTSAEFQRKITYRTKQYSNRKNNTTCEICGLDFHSKTSRYGHMRTEHPSHFQFECRICEERFIRESAAKEHEKHHVLGELQCPACSMRFIHMAHLQNHTKKNHPKFSNFPCQYCSSITPSVEALHSHIKIHHGDCLGLPDAFPCGICSEVFHTGTAVSAHRSNYHPGTTFCRICNSQVSKRYLKKHINAVHTKEKTHNCVSCDKIFFSRTSLNNHRKRHHAPRKHLCHLCGKGYVFNVELQRHLKAHRNQRDFKCDFCGRSFLKAGELTYHRRSHTGERPHKCSQCHETFVRPLALRKHIQNKHTENKKRKYLRYSKRKIDELASSVIMESNRDENLQQHGRNHGTLGEMAPINLESSQLSSIDLEKNQGLGQVFGNVNMVPNHRAQHSSDMTGLPSGDNQMLSIGSSSNNQMVSEGVVSGNAVSGGQLELSGVVEDELLEMSSDLLIDDVRETTDEATAVGGLREVTAAAVETTIRENQQRTGELVSQQDGQAQAQPVQVIYVQFDSLY